MLARLGDRLSAFFRATAPDPFVIAVLLTLLTLVLALTLTDTTARGLVAAWSADSGLWQFLKFSMQMCLILVTGHAVACSPPVARLINRLASLPRTGAQAAALIALVAALLGVLNWGLGLIGGALLARDVGRAMNKRGITVHYPLLAAAGYVGLMVWHGGLSGTAPIKVTKESEIADIFAASGVTMKPLLLDETLFSTLNFVTTGGLIAIAVLVMAMLSPRRADGATIHTPDRFLPDDKPREDQTDNDKPLVPRLLEDTPIINIALALLILAWAVPYYFPAEGPSGILELTPNTVNLTMLMIGLVLHGTPRRYVGAIEDAARGCAGIILQFPLYAGIMGMMHSSGLTRQFAESIAQSSNLTTLPLFTFVSAGVVNLFIPSGGGQWGVQGPIAISSALDAARDAGLTEPETRSLMAKMVMSVAYGDQLTNMLQPFWALPLLAITGVKARDIVGYTAILMVIAGAWVTLCLLAF